MVRPEKAALSRGRKLSAALLSQSLLVGNVVVVSQRVVNIGFLDATCVGTTSYAVRLLENYKDFLNL